NRFKRMPSGKFELTRNVYNSILPSHSVDAEEMAIYYAPSLYTEVMFGKDMILSPFVRANRKYYRFTFDYDEDQVKMHFRPFHKNTMLIEGDAYIDTATGQIKSTTFKGNYDMYAFTMDIEQDDQGLPRKSKVSSKFNFLGNKQQNNITSYYGLTTTLPDSIRDVESPEMIEALRPEELSDLEKLAYELHEKKNELKHVNDEPADTTTTEHHTSKFSKAMKRIGDSMWGSTRVRSEHSYVRLSPLLNPFMMEFSQRKGFTYLLEFTLKHDWGKHSKLILDPYFAYAFKERQVYYGAPIDLYYNTKRNAGFFFNIESGDRVASSVVRQQVTEIGLDSLLDSDINYFRDTKIQFGHRYDILRNLSLTAGATFHRRTAINKEMLADIEGDTKSKTFAPYLDLSFRFPKMGPIFRVNYEVGLKDVMGGENDFSRLEVDANYKLRMKRMRTLSMRLGAGRYISDADYYFMDYENFRRNNLPEGWNDDWTGDFQNLSSYQYNISKYYVRGNMTYDAPLLCLYWLPVVGRFVETERIYLNVLATEHFHPYVEVGYGIKNRLFSGGVFVGFNKEKFDGVEFKIDLELFNR
ncbi:MAG: DUF5686 family protein, partial [Prevotellaceae bacterium]|nr:DUF5686 family protein [Prevotellaceae bacterium]